MRHPVSLTLLGIAFLASPYPADAQKTGRWAGYGAGAGALLGLVAGDDVGDVVVGAALGAAGGGVAGAISDSNDAKRAEAERAAAAQRRAEEERRRQAEEQQARVRAEQSKADAAAAARTGAEDEEARIVAAIGKDNYESYQALRACQYDRATLLAKAGATSDNPEHQLASLWLDALIAVEKKDKAATEAAFEQVVARDPDIDTVQQAGLEADRVVLDIRRERSDMGLSCKR